MACVYTYRGKEYSESEFKELLVEQHLSDVSKTPDTPFAKTEEWAMLAFKRMIQHAAQQNFDRLVWTPGEVHADRYSLKKRIGMVEYEETSPGKYYLNVKDKGNFSVMTEYQQTLEQIEEKIGKSLATMIADGKGQPNSDGGGKYITDDEFDESIGGEGMISFYDKMLPKAVNKDLKQWGERVQADRLATTKEQLREVFQMREGQTPDQYDMD
jgi:hypothetical protein